MHRDEKAYIKIIKYEETSCSDSFEMFLMSARLVGILLLGVKSSGHNSLTRCHCDPLRSTVRWSCWTIRPSALGAVAGLPCAVAPEGSSFVHVLEPMGAEEGESESPLLGLPRSSRPANSLQFKGLPSTPSASPEQAEK